MAPGRSCMTDFENRKSRWPWWDAREDAYEIWKEKDIRKAPNEESQAPCVKRMRFSDDTKEENINGAECERKQGNDEGSSLQLKRW